MILAKLFPSVRRLEVELQKLNERREQDWKAHAEGVSLICEAHRDTLNAITYRHAGELDRKSEEIRELREHILGLMDRICLQNRTVPISESLKSEAKAGADKLEQVATLVDQSIRKSGPVAGRRADVEQQVKAARAEAEAMRERAVAPHLAATNELDDVMHP